MVRHIIIADSQAELDTLHADTVYRAGTILVRENGVYRLVKAEWKNGGALGVFEALKEAL